MATRSLGQLTVDLIARTFGFEQGMDRAARKAKTSGKEIEGALTKTFAFAGGAVAGFVASIASVDVALRGFNGAVDYADRIDELSKRFGVGTEVLSEWSYAAKQNGADLEKLASALPKLSKAVAEASDQNSKAGKTFTALGIAVKDQAGNLRSVEDILPEVADRFRGLNNQTLETALAMELFGRSGAELLEFLNLGSEGLSEMAETARDLGIVIDSETAAKAADFKDRIDDLRAATQGWFTQISAALLPVLTDLTVELIEFVKNGGSAAEVADRVADSIRGIADAIRLVGSVGDVLDRLRGGLAGLELQGNAAFQSLNPLNWNPQDLARLGEQYRKGTAYVENGWQAMQDAQRRGAEQFQVQVLDPSEGFGSYKAQKRLEEQAQKYQEALGRLFAGEDKASKGGKSAAERQAEELARAYDQLAAQLDRQISLYGDATREAEVRYEVEFGALQKLAPQLKDYLVYKAQEYDLLVAAEKQRKEEAKWQERENQRITRGLEAGRALLSDLEFELSLMRMSNAERATAIQLRGLEAEAVAAYGDAIAEMNERIEQEMEAADALDDFRHEIVDFVDDATWGTKKVGEAFADMMMSIARSLANRAVMKGIEQLFGAFGTSAGGGGWFSAIASLFSGGRAGGGSIAPGHFAEVNEVGMETATVRGRTYLIAGGDPVQVKAAQRGGAVGAVEMPKINVQIIKGANEDRVESSRSPTGDLNLKILVRDTVRGLIAGAELDEAMGQRFGVRPTGVPRG